MVRKLLFEKKREDMTKDNVQEESEIVEGTLLDEESHSDSERKTDQTDILSQEASEDAPADIERSDGGGVEREEWSGTSQYNVEEAHLPSSMGTLIYPPIRQQSERLTTLNEEPLPSNAIRHQQEGYFTADNNDTSETTTSSNIWESPGLQPTGIPRTTTKRRMAQIPEGLSPRSSTSSRKEVQRRDESSGAQVETNYIEPPMSQPRRIQSAPPLKRIQSIRRGQGKSISELEKKKKPQQFNSAHIYNKFLSAVEAEEPFLSTARDQVVDGLSSDETVIIAPPQRATPSRLVPQGANRLGNELPLVPPPMYRVLNLDKPTRRSMPIEPPSVASQESQGSGDVQPGAYTMAFGNPFRHGFDEAPPEERIGSLQLYTPPHEARVGSPQLTRPPLCTPPTSAQSSPPNRPHESAVHESPPILSRNLSGDGRVTTSQIDQVISHTVLEEGIDSDMFQTVYPEPLLAEVQMVQIPPPEEAPPATIQEETSKDHSLLSKKGQVILLMMTCLGLVVGLVVGLSLGLTSDEAASAVDRKSYLLAALDYLSSDTSVLQDPSSPQALALDWLANWDDAKVALDDQERLEARFALATLYLATQEGVEGWSDDLKFLSGNHECDWTSIFDSLQQQQGVKCDADDRVIGLALGKQYSLSNSITRNIYLVVLLVLITVLICFCMTDGNGLQGSIPEELQALSRLESLSLTNHTLPGTIPWTALANDVDGVWYVSSSLKYLDLSGSLLDLSLPSSEEDLSFNDLRQLYLGGNKIYGPFPWSSIKSDQLVDIDLNDNRFTGEIPSDIGRFTNLRTLILLDNDLEGTIPESIGNLTKLESLVIRSNGFSGTVPGRISSLTSLVELDISENRLEGQLLPDTLSGMFQLRTLNFAHNRFTGEIPRDLALLTNLGKCTISSCEAISPYQFFLTSIRYYSTTSAERLSLHGNLFTGEFEFLCVNNPRLRIDIDRVNLSCSCCKVIPNNCTLHSHVGCVPGNY
jgi:hypothetical protein